jgi:hypothetical protein
LNEAPTGAGTETPPAAFPDCWTAYGATDAEVQAYGTVWPLDARAGWWLFVAQAAIGGLSGVGAIWVAPSAERLVFLAVALAALLSALVSALRLYVTAQQVTPQPARLVLRSAWGATATVPWEQIGEIALANRRQGRLAALRLRSPVQRGGPGGGLLAAAARRFSGGYDWLLAPRDGDAALFSRILLRYCIDPRARRRYLAAIPLSAGRSGH